MHAFTNGSPDPLKSWLELIPYHYSSVNQLGEHLRSPPFDDYVSELLPSRHPFYKELVDLLRLHALLRMLVILLANQCSDAVIFYDNLPVMLIDFDSSGRAASARYNILPFVIPYAPAASPGGLVTAEHDNWRVVSAESFFK